MEVDRLNLSYVLPIRSSAPQTGSEFSAYLRTISERAELIVVDGSDAGVFSEHERAWGDCVLHLKPDADLATPMGKVGGVLTGVRHASFSMIIIADDDIRYDDGGLCAVVRALEKADVVRPQNFFSPMPWHALWDTGRILLNRVSDGDWPGTLGVRREILERTGGYDGGVMFENLELVRTVVAVGGREAQLPGTFVARRPSSTRHFWSQRIRQAYDEFARPKRLLFQLSWLPAMVAGTSFVGWMMPAAVTASALVLAEAGRRIHGGHRVFPATAVLFAPVWIMERAVCAWLAVIARVVYGGIPYRGTVLRRAATPPHLLRQRLGSASPQYRSA